MNDKIPKRHIEWFEHIQVQQLCLARCRNRTTGEMETLLCVSIKQGDMTELYPMAKMIDVEQPTRLYDKPGAKPQLN